MRKIALAIAAILLAICLADWGYSSFAPCNNHPDQNTGEQSANNNCAANRSVTLRFLGPAFRSIYDFAEHYDKAIISISTAFIAVFTIVLGIFTVRLSGSTRIAADAADLSARASIAVEAPIVAAIDIGLKRYTTWTGMDPAQLPRESCDIYVQVENFGRTPAILLRSCVNWKIIESLPATPDYGAIKDYGIGSVIKADENKTFTTGSRAVTFTDDQISEVSDGKKLLWVFGFVEFRDFTGNIHTTGYCASWTWISGRSHQFAEAGPKSYRYQT